MRRGVGSDRRDQQRSLFAPVRRREDDRLRRDAEVRPAHVSALEQLVEHAIDGLDLQSERGTSSQRRVVQSYERTRGIHECTA